MLEIKIPKEIEDYEPKLAWGLTTKNIISVAVIAITAIPLYVFGRQYLSADELQWIIMLIVAPIAALGFFPKWNGIKLESLLKNWWNMNWNPQRRRYGEISVFWLARAEIIEDDLNIQRVQARIDKKSAKLAKKNVKKSKKTQKTKK
ncbi:MAG: PrgI family protein [Clostridiales bacterium]|nr:PrgI family protein [Clostridiales bacterium]